MLHRKLARGISGWLAFYADRRRKLAAMEQALSYLLNRSLARGWLAQHQAAEAFVERVR